MYIENLLRPLQLFYFHLWPIYWLSLVSYSIIDIILKNAAINKLKILHFINYMPSYLLNEPFQTLWVIKHWMIANEELSRRPPSPALSTTAAFPWSGYRESLENGELI
jgi:hypothetical protein